MSPLFRTLRRRDFSPERILPKSDSDGGNVWFSCENNCNKSPSRCWLAMYKRPKSEALLRWSVSCCDVFYFFLHMGVLKRGSEFFLSDLWMDLFLSKITSWQYCWYFAVAIKWIDRTVPITELSAQSLEFIINNSGQGVCIGGIGVVLSPLMWVQRRWLVWQRELDTSMALRNCNVYEVRTNELIEVSFQQIQL